MTDNTCCRCGISGTLRGVKMSEILAVACCAMVAMFAMGSIGANYKA